MIRPVAHRWPRHHQDSMHSASHRPSLSLSPRWAGASSRPRPLTMIVWMWDNLRWIRSLEWAADCILYRSHLCSLISKEWASWIKKWCLSMILTHICDGTSSCRVKRLLNVSQCAGRSSLSHRSALFSLITILMKALYFHQLRRLRLSSWHGLLSKI